MSQKLKEMIDRMVEDSIRRILPAVMNEVLLKTIANSGVIRESSGDRNARQAFREASTPRPVLKNRKESGSLRQLLDPEVGADFYGQSEPVQESAPRPVLAQRINQLPPQLRELARDVKLDEDPGEMWEDSEVDAGMIAESSSSGPRLDKAAQAVGLDFSRMKQAIVATSPKKVPIDASARAQFEEGRIKRMREQLNGGKPVE